MKGSTSRVRFALAVAACTATSVLATGGAEAGQPATRAGSLLLRPNIGGDIVMVPYAWRFGSQVPRATRPEIQLRDGDRWRSLSTVPLAFSTGYVWGDGPWSGSGWAWDTADVPEGVYVLRLLVPATGYASEPTRYFVDHTAPEVEILSPKRIGPVSGAPVTVVAGAAKLTASYDDQPPGGGEVSWRGSVWSFASMRGVIWWIRNERTGEERRIDAWPYFWSPTFDFGADPGLYTVTVEAGDFAGNWSKRTIRVLALPSNDSPTTPEPLN